MDPSADFPTTHWTSVFGASVEGDAGIEKLGDLYRRYERPCRRYLETKLKISVTEAEDLWADFVQDKLIAERILTRLDRRESFRGFLRKAMHHYGVNWLRRRSTKARAPERGIASLDAFDDVPDTEEAPDYQFDLDVANALRDLAIERTKTAFQEYQGPASSWEVFHDCVLAPLVSGEPATKPGAAALRYGLSPFQVTRLLNWGKARFRQILDEVIAESSPNAVDIEAERSALLHLFGRLPKTQTGGE